MIVIDWLKANPKSSIAIGIAVALAAGYGAGRFAAPTKVEIKERVVERQVVDEKEMARRLETAKIEWAKSVQDHSTIHVVYKDGKVVERIVYVDKDTESHGAKVETKIEYVDREKIVTVEKVVEKEKLVERDCPRVTLLGSLGASIAGGTLGPPAYGLEGNGRVWGPLVIGLGGEGNGQYVSGRVLAGIQF
jgi:hypothetical protein